MSKEVRLLDTFIEIPKNSANKYEYDKQQKVFRLDRTLYPAMHYPTDYGFVPDSLAEDGDPLDVLVLVTNPTFPGCVISTRVLGALKMSDEAGVDHKILGVAAKDPRFKEFSSLDDVPPHTLKEIEHFFRTYKELEGKQTVIDGWVDLQETDQIVSEAFARYHA